jgi:hypothetical protein
MPEQVLIGAPQKSALSATKLSADAGRSGKEWGSFMHCRRGTGDERYLVTDAHH